LERSERGLGGGKSSGEACFGNGHRGSSVSDDLTLVRYEMKFTRITVNPNQTGGVPCVRGLRIPVASIVDMIADGMGTEEILEAYPDLEREDITEALRYAAEAVREGELPNSSQSPT
jgi:uncharacterized protein (DUF433 family)